MIMILITILTALINVEARKYGSEFLNMELQGLVLDEERRLDCNLTCNMGMCVVIMEEEMCNCMSPYINEEKDGTTEYCVYKAKKKLTAFLLAILVGGTGADWFYLSCGDGLFIFAGIMKIFFTCCLPTCLQSVLLNGSDDGGAMVIIGCCVCCGIMGWYITDWVMVLTDQRTDGTGMGLYMDM